VCKNKTSILATAAMSVDYANDAVFTQSAFHAPGCRHLQLADAPEIQPTWISFYRITPPCRTCHTARECNAWIQRLRWLHQGCAPRSPFCPRITTSSDKRRVGRPRSLPPETLQRVLQLHELGEGYRTIVRLLGESGVDASIWSVRRAVLGLGAYQRDP
jgi:hypothetical protein